MSVTVLAAHLPYFHLGAIETGVVPIQAFGILVATGVLIGASLLRRYAEWHGVSDDDIRGLTAWVTVSGFIGAHLFDVLAYQWDALATPGYDHYQGPILLLKIWDGISSYGGFLGGAAGFAFYVWWKRLPARLMADITIMGLLPAFSIGRIGCTVVSDHIGAMVDKTQWYAALAMDYPLTYFKDNPNKLDYTQITAPVYKLAVDNKVVSTALAAHQPLPETLTAWNLGLIELLWLIPVNALILWLGFRSSKRPNAGLIVVLTGVLYAPVRFFLDFLRPEETDPRYWGLTFAQWSSILAFGVAGYVATLIMKNGKPAEVVAKTSGEAQARLKVILHEQEKEEKEAADKDDDEPAAASEQPKKKRKKKKKVQPAAETETAADADADASDEKKADSDDEPKAAPLPPTLGPDD